MTGRDRRLLFEYNNLTARLASRPCVSFSVLHRNPAGFPVHYLVSFDVHSIASVHSLDRFGLPGVSNPPIFADHFLLDLSLPDDYPSIDAQPVFSFRTADALGHPIPHPWHPNIRWFGPFAGRVCLNLQDSYTDLAWSLLRIEQYLRYHRYHALNEPPFPEDQLVASWVIRQAEPNGWLNFDATPFLFPQSAR